MRIFDSGHFLPPAVSLVLIASATAVIFASCGSKPVPSAEINNLAASWAVSGLYESKTEPAGSSQSDPPAVSAAPSKITANSKKPEPASKPAANPPQQASLAGAQNLMQGINAGDVNVSGALTPSFEKSAQDFSARLFQRVYTPGKNTLISPVSASLALGMTANGAAGDTRKQFETILGRYGQDVNSLNQGYKALTDRLTAVSGSTKLAVSNSLWVSKDFKVYQSFLQTNANYYGAGAHSTDFSSPLAAEAMNAWVSEKTGGKIKSLIKETDSNDVMFLLNAVFLDAKWQTPFDEDSPSYTGAFAAENGKTVSATFMSLAHELKVAQGKQESAVLLPYDDGKLAMLCILPNKGVSLKNYIAAMTGDTIPSLLSHADEKFALVTLPKLDFQTSYSLNNPLIAMGLVCAFDYSADFSALGKAGRSVYISSVTQKATLKVDEQGTVATAATKVEIQTKGAFIPDVRLIFDRPFLAAVVDLKTGLPLFLASVANPGA